MDCQISPATLLILYAAYARGSVLDTIDRGRDASFACAELQHRF